ncbi:MAG: class I SAM-dependent methyltransferase [Actinomycetota bacterium]
MSSNPPSPEELERRNDKVRRSWAKRAAQYDKSIGFFERRVFGSEHREWACSRATGKTLEVAVGTGLNLTHYPDDVRLTGIDLSPEMLTIARDRAASLGRKADLKRGDAHELPFEDASFDTVVCTYSLCNIPDASRSVGEMKRVVRPDGRLVLVDHIRSAVKPIFWFRKAIEFFTRRLEGEHMTRRPLEQVEAEGFEIQERDRLRAGVIERLVATSRTANRTIGIRR